MRRFLEFNLPFVLLLIIILYTYAYFGEMSYLGFYYTYKEEITDVYTDDGDELLGATLIAVDGENWADMRNNIFVPVLPDVEPGQRLQLTLDYDGEIRVVDWVTPTDTRIEFLARVQGVWWMPFMFWFAGLFSWFMLRPRNQVWLLIMSFNLMLALYIAALRGPSLGHFYFSESLVRFLGVLVFPVFLHLHWVFPKPLPNVLIHLRRVSYWAIGVIALLSGLNLLPKEVFHVFSFAAVIGSVILVLLKVVIQKDARHDNLFILFVFCLFFIPPVITTAAYSYFDLHINIQQFAGAYLILPALPGAYFIVAFQKDVYGTRIRRRIRRLYLGIVVVSNLVVGSMLISLLRLDWQSSFNGVIILTMLAAGASFTVVLAPLVGIMGIPIWSEAGREDAGLTISPRANPYIVPYLFLIGAGMFFFLMLIFVTEPARLSIREINMVMITGLIVTIAVMFGYPLFQRWVERRLFNLVRPSDELIESFSQRITTTLNVQQLSSLLTKVVLPSLLIQQSALFYQNVSGRFVKLFSIGVDPEFKLSHRKVMRQLKPADVDEGVLVNTSTNELPDWVRLVFPLSIRGKLIGYWFFGARDPNDEYTPMDLSLIHLIGNQTTIALSNILTTIQLHNYYQNDIDEEEADRVDIARGLHDQVLNQLASLYMLISQDAPKEKLLESYEKTKLNLRTIISRLRPQVLEFGLGHAVHELASQLREVYDGTEFIVDLPYASPRYDAQVENHVFNILQQVCENVFLHAHAEKVVVSGEFYEDRLHISVVDNGIGFDFKGMDFSHMIELKHFGLVGVFERADLINATLIFDSAPGTGTSVDLHWMKSGA